MSAGIEHIVVDLEDAAKHLDRHRAAALSAELIQRFRIQGAEIPEREARKAFSCLRRKRWFAQLEKAVEAYIDYVAPSPLVRTLYAQALIDQDQLVAGLAVAEEALRHAPAGSRAAEEARGLVGRAYKQAFVRAADGRSLHAQDSLRLAVRAYAEAYEAAVLDRPWPGVNLLALVARARVDGLDVRMSVDVPALATDVLAQVEAELGKEANAAEAAGREPYEQPWLFASGLEASLALQRTDGALMWFKRYLACRTTDAFELGSTARQLRELWRLDRHPERAVATMLPMLEAELLAKAGGQVNDPVRRSSSLVDARELQAVYGSEHFYHREWLDNGLKAGDAVGRVHDVSGSVKGTGFLLRGRHLRDSWGDQQVFVTNRHVIDDSEPLKGVHPRRALVRFTTHDGADSSPGVPVDRILWKSDLEMDVAIVSLKRTVQRDMVLEIADTGNLRTIDPASRIYVIGHPSGESISYSLYDNELVELAPPYLYYHSPTRGGSSGSPLLNRDWWVVGIHHHAAPDRDVNGGSLLSAVRSALEG